ncbi:hypothetical protein O3P69_004189 [Scylla paramamosain]|uniref:Uncharacterized protein n=1 Tax=Scylla paramamosain TaxID=85552 RepID=A0AAW0UFJ7_SCYPA
MWWRGGGGGRVASTSPQRWRVICDRHAALHHTAHRFHGLSDVYLARHGIESQRLLLEPETYCRGSAGCLGLPRALPAARFLSTPFPHLPARHWWWFSFTAAVGLPLKTGIRRPSCILLSAVPESVTSQVACAEVRMPGQLECCLRI